MNPSEILDRVIENAIEDLERTSVVLDFTDTFTSKRKLTRPVPRNRTLNENLPPNEQATSQIPENISNSVETIKDRKVFDPKRWCCMSRPQYSKSCGITSLVSCWNFLFSRIGNGSFDPLTQEKALVILGIEPPFSTIRFGPFTGNSTLISWFNRLLAHFRVSGQARICWKLYGRDKTEGVTREQAFTMLCEGLATDNQAFIYHCYNHYMCPIGYELTPKNPPDAYKRTSELCEYVPWVIIGESSLKHPPIHVKKWDDICLDIEQESPNFYDVRHQDLGVQTKSKLSSSNLHCLLVFEKLDK